MCTNFWNLVIPSVLNLTYNGIKLFGMRIFLYAYHIFSAPKVCFHLFADDTCLSIQTNPTKKWKLRLIFLDNIANWLKANKLRLNVKKSNLLVFDSRKNSKEKPPVKL